MGWTSKSISQPQLNVVLIRVAFVMVSVHSSHTLTKTHLQRVGHANELVLTSGFSQTTNLVLLSQNFQTQAMCSTTGNFPPWGSVSGWSPFKLYNLKPSPNLHPTSRNQLVVSHFSTICESTWGNFLLLWLNTIDWVVIFFKKMKLKFYSSEAWEAQGQIAPLSEVPLASRDSVVP